MKDERFDPEEMRLLQESAARDMERLKADANYCSRDEAEEQRLMELGRRVEQLLKQEARDHAPGLREAINHAAPTYLSTAALFSIAEASFRWFLSVLDVGKESPNG